MSLAAAWQTVKGRRGGFAAAFVAVLTGSAVITACGILLESSVRAGVPADRYRGADVVVAAPQALPVPDDVDQRFAERARLPAGLTAEVAAVPGVAAAIPDTGVSVSIDTSDASDMSGTFGSSGTATGHGWQSAVLGPFTLAAGRAPAGPDEVVLAGEAGLPAGSRVRLTVGSVTAAYRVSGVTDGPRGGPGRRGTVFFTDEQARLLSGRPDRVDAIGVLAAPGFSAADLAAAIEAAVPGVAAHTGDGRSEAEFLDVGDARAFLGELTLAFGGSMVVVIMTVVASTLALSVRQRLRELALLRAIGATPRQVLRMIVAETVVVGASGALLGVVPGLGLSLLLREAFVLAGAVPGDFGLVIGPLPAVAAVALALLGAVAGGRIAARRAARLRPVEALGEAALEPPRLGRLRVAAGVLLIPAGLAAALVLPLTLPGESAAESAALSAFLLVFAVALLGPRLLTGVVAVLGPRLNRVTDAGGFLAVANAHAHPRRLAAATIPLIMGVALAAGQLFSAATVESAVRDQAAAGLRAGYVVTATSAGLSPEVAGLLRDVPGVTAATPVVRSRVLATFTSGDSPQFRSYAAQGVTGDRLAETMDLGVLDGDIAALRAGAVGLSRIAAGTLGARLGDTVDLRLGDGTAITPTVVAIYERGFGAGDVTLPHDLVLEHTTDRLDAAVLIAADSSLGELRSAVRHLPAVRVDDRATFTAAQHEAAAGDTAVGLILNGVLLGYLSIAVVNTLVTATAARHREFALLRLVGATRRQVLAMMRGEARIIVVAGVGLGALAAIPPLVGTSLGLTRSPVPSVPPLTCLAIVAAAALLGWGAVMIPARLTVRRRPIDAIGGRE